MEYAPPTHEEVMAQWELDLAAAQAGTLVTSGGVPGVPAGTPIPVGGPDLTLEEFTVLLEEPAGTDIQDFGPLDIPITEEFGPVITGPEEPDVGLWPGTFDREYIAKTNDVGDTGVGTGAGMGMGLLLLTLFTLRR